jgi:hypothetical protein
MLVISEITTLSVYGSVCVSADRRYKMRMVLGRVVQYTRWSALILTLDNADLLRILNSNLRQVYIINIFPTFGANLAAASFIFEERKRAGKNCCLDKHYSVCIFYTLLDKKDLIALFTVA